MAYAAAPDERTYAGHLPRRTMRPRSDRIQTPQPPPSAGLNDASV